MRKFFVPLLLASVIFPATAMAQDIDREESQAHRADSHESPQRQEHAERPQRAQRIERVESPQRTQRMEQFQRWMHVEQAPRVSQVQETHHSNSPSNGGHREYHRDVRQDHGDLHASDPSRREHRGYHRDQRRDHRTEHRSWDRNSGRAGHGDYHRDVNAEHSELHASNPTRGEHRDGHRDLSRQHDRRHSAWDTSWRSNRSYDWRGYRGRYSSVYNLSPYRDPYGWGYRRFSIGFSIGSGYYGSNYWLSDPGMYRLPPAYGPYRWVRYYDDALLVNIYSGQVVDVIHNFFW